MTAPLTPLRAGTDAALTTRRHDPRLAKTAQQLEGLFVQQLFAAMRDTIPTDGPMSGGPGGEMFTAMLHEHLAEEAPARWERGLASNIAAQMAAAARTALPAGSTPEPR
jgi:peptidoglycan hydrolase FlgJ